MTWRRSTASSSLHGRSNGLVPGAGSRVPASSSAISSSIGRALSAAASYQELKIFRKIHWVHL